jgi:hypothetical protein
VPARAVTIEILTNSYYWPFYNQTTPREPGYPNNSITGLAEVQFLGGSTASVDDFAPGTLTGSVVIPAGQSAVELEIPALSTGTLGAELTLELTSDDTVYSVGTPDSATITIVDP